MYSKVLIDMLTTSTVCGASQLFLTTVISALAGPATATNAIITPKTFSVFIVYLSHTKRERSICWRSVAQTDGKTREMPLGSKSVLEAGTSVRLQHVPPHRGFALDHGGDGEAVADALDSDLADASHLNVKHLASPWIC